MTCLETVADPKARHGGEMAAKPSWRPGLNEIRLAQTQVSQARLSTFEARYALDGGASVIGVVSENMISRVAAEFHRLGLS